MEPRGMCIVKNNSSCIGRINPFAVTTFLIPLLSFDQSPVSI